MSYGSTPAEQNGPVASSRCRPLESTLSAPVRIGGPLFAVEIVSADSGPCQVSVQISSLRRPRMSGNSCSRTLVAGGAGVGAENMSSETGAPCAPTSLPMHSTWRMLGSSLSLFEARYVLGTTAVGTAGERGPESAPV